MDDVTKKAVAWLRREAERIASAVLTLTDYRIGRIDSLNVAADALERGEHLKDTGE